MVDFSNGIVKIFKIIGKVAKRERIVSVKVRESEAVQVTVFWSAKIAPLGRESG